MKNSKKTSLRALAIMIIIVFCCQDAWADGCGWFRGRPLPECKAFWVLESAWNFRQSGTSIREGKKEFLFTADIGYMKNITAKSGIGLTAHMGADDDAGQFGLRARYRLWFDRDVYLDISPGILIAGEDNHSHPKFPGFVGTAALGFGDWVALVFQYQMIRFEDLSYIDDAWIDHSVPQGTQKTSYIGVRFGSYLAIALPVVLLLIYGMQSSSTQGLN